MNSNFQITVAELSPEIDEAEICLRAKPGLVRWVTLSRTKRTSPSLEEIETWRQEILYPIRPHLNTSEITAAYFRHDSSAGRGVFWVSVQDHIRLQKACKLTSHTHRPFNQPIRVTVEYNHTTSIHAQLYKFVEPEIIELSTFARTKNCIVTINQPKSSHAKFVHLRCCNAAVIGQFQKKLENISTSTRFHHDSSHRLFTSYGEWKLRDLQKSVFFHWNPATHAVHIYGPPAQQDKTKGKLNALLSRLCEIEEFDKTLFLKRTKLDFKKKSEKIERICTSVGLEYFRFLGSSRLLVTGSSVKVQKVEEELEKVDILFRKTPSVLTKWVKKPDCCICGGPPDYPFVRSSVCSHLYCLDCITPMFTGLIYPVKCPGAECERLMSIADIQKIAGRSEINKLLELAVIKYQELKKEDIFLCPREDCGQLLRAEDKITGNFAAFYKLFWILD